LAITPTSLQTIITAARLRIDMRNSQFLSDGEFTSLIYASLAQLDSILVSKFDDYKLISAPATVVSGGNTISLPSDFLKFRGLDMLYNSGTPDGYVSIRQHSFQKRNDNYLSGFSRVYGPMNITYRLQGNSLLILPAQIAGNYTYRLWYVPDFIPLVLPTDTLQSYMDSQLWYDYAVCDTAAKAATMQDLPNADQLYQQAEQLRDHLIRLSTPNRDSGEPKAVVDTRYDDSIGGWGWTW
jgi:hypothetical protein